MPLLKSKPVQQTVDAPKQESPTPEQLAQVAAAKHTIAKASKATASDTMSKADWAAKDVRISRQGLFQAALQSVGILQLNTGNTLEDYMKLVEQVAERGLQFVNKA
jgi:hypothetical protein